jgi:hypothetical protein
MLRYSFRAWEFGVRLRPWVTQHVHIEIIVAFQTGSMDAGIPRFNVSHGFYGF